MLETFTMMDNEELRIVRICASDGITILVGIDIQNKGRVCTNRTSNFRHGRGRGNGRVCNEQSFGMVEGCSEATTTTRGPRIEGFIVSVCLRCGISSEPPF